MHTFTYTPKDFVKHQIEWKQNDCYSKFDELLKSTWEKAMKDGKFRYTLDKCKRRSFDAFEDVETCVRFPCVGCLNEERATNRRKPDVFPSMNAAFEHKKFNFNKIKEDEILFYVNNIEKDGSSEDPIIINVSPLEYGHFLFVPDRRSSLPQKMTKLALLKAVHLVQLSSQPGFRVGFNSLNAWASVNHLHFQCMYINSPLFVDSMRSGKLITPLCHLIAEPHLLPGFIIETDSTGNMEQICSISTTITDILHEIEIPYNFIITRALKQEKIRIALWPRKTSKGLEASSSFSIACVEVGGYYPFRTEECYKNFTPKMVREQFKVAELDDGVFKSIVQKVTEALTFINGES